MPNIFLQEFDRLDKETVPEIMRCSISTVILQMLSIGITNVSKFDFLDPPPQDAVEGALRQLHLLGNISKIHYLWTVNDVLKS